MWPTPSGQEPGWNNIEVVDKDGNPPEHWNQRFYDGRTGRLVQKGLTQAVRMWPTPRVQDSYERSNWRTVRGANEDGFAMMTLSRKVKYSDATNRRWPTPKEGDWRSGLQRRQFDTMLNVEACRREGVSGSGGQLNPDWVELLMGYPRGWTALKPMDMGEFGAWREGFADGNPEVSYGVRAWLDGSWEAGTSRIASGTPNRVSRLKALGDGQVPLVVATAWKILSEEAGWTP